MSSSSMKRRLTMSRMASLGVKCSPRGLVGKLGELADEFLEDGTHLGIVDSLRVEGPGPGFALAALPD